MIKTLEIRQITATPVGYSLTSIYLFTLVLLVNIVVIKMKLFTYWNQLAIVFDNLSNKYKITHCAELDLT